MTAVDAVYAEERELARKATPKHTGPRKRPAYTGPKTLAELKGVKLPAEAVHAPTTPGEPAQAVLADFVPAPGNFATAEAALNFILAGNAYFTVRSQKTRTRYTFCVNRPKKAESCTWCRRTPCICSPSYFVALLTGPENTSDYSYLR